MQNILNIIYKHRYQIIFFVFFIFYVLTAYYLTFNLHHAFNDAITRVEKALLVLYDNTPKLASIGFIWPPLPSLIQIPIILFFKNLSIYGFSGTIVTSFFGALSTMYIYRFLEYASLGKKTTFLLLLAYALNPMIIFYSVNGMSEMILLSFVVIIAWNLLRWFDTEKIIHLFAIGMMLSLAFLTRYETLALIPSIAAIVTLTKSRQMVDGKMHPFKNIAKAINYGVFVATPGIITVIVWILLNWIIMGDPLNFFHGDYSVSVQSELVEGAAYTASQNIFITLFYNTKRILLLYPMFMLLILFVVIMKKYYWRLLSMVLLSLTIPAFEILVHFLGKSYGWLRFFIYIIPFSFIIISILFAKDNKNKLPRPLLNFFVLLSLLSSAVSLLTMANPHYGKEEYIATNAFLRNVQVAQLLLPEISEIRGIPRPLDATYDNDVEIADYIHVHIPENKKILMDDFFGIDILLNHGNPKQFINNTDNEFDKAVQNPQKYADYVLIPSPIVNPITSIDMLNRTYKDIYKNGAPFLELVKEFSQRWKLYRVIHTNDKK